MQCWQAPDARVLGRAMAQHRPSRGLALQVHNKLKYRADISQNHNRKSAWINVDVDRLLQQPSYNPGRQMGPLKLQQLTGRGRGVVADRDLPPSETLMVCEPLAGGALSGPEGQELLPEHLAQWLTQAQAAGALTPADRARARLLYDGTPADSPSSRRARAATLDDFRRLEDKLRRAAEAPKKPKGRGFGAPGPAAGGGAAGAATAAAPAGGGIDMAALGEEPLTPDEISRLARYCSWGNSFSDLGAAPLRKEASQAIIGVWPEFSLLNHSCAPNTVAFNLGQLLLVKATRNIPRAAEVTTSYLADLVHSPLEARREALRGAYGFTCECERCQAESSLPAEVSAAVSAAFSLGSSRESLQVANEAVGKSDRGVLRPLEEGLEAAVSRLEAAMEAAKLEEQVRSWLRNSAYPAYVTLTTIRDLPGPRAGGLFGGLQPQPPGTPQPFSDPEAPRQLAAMVAEVAPGTDPHLYLVLETLTRAAETLPRDHPVLAEVSKDLLRAHILRYGKVSDALLWELIRMRSRTQSYLGRINLGPSEQTQTQPGASGAVPLFGGPLVASPAQLRQAAAEVAGPAEAAAGKV